MLPQNNNDIEKDAEKIGERLALLLSAADLTDEVKEGFMALVPEMTLEQIDKLMKALEMNVVDSSLFDKSELGKNLQGAITEYETERKAAEDTAMGELEKIEQELKQAEK